MENLTPPSGRDPSALSQAAIENWLQAAVAKALEKPVSSIAKDVPLSEMGVDSVEAVALTGDLEDWSGLEVDPTLVFDYPTIAALASHLKGV